MQAICKGEYVEKLENGEKNDKRSLFRKNQE